MKRKILIALLAILTVCALTLALAACGQHKCNDACKECGLCLTGCKDSACSKKCLGHGEQGNENENDGEQSEAQVFAVTFVCDQYATVYVYETQDMSSAGEQTTTAYSRDSDTGALLDDGNGQVNFKLVFADGYELADIVITPQTGYNNLKGSADTGVENGYRITKISAALTVTVTSKEEGSLEDLTQGYKVTFDCDEHVTAVVYRTQDMSANGEITDTAYSRESGTGALTKDGEGQVNFILLFDDGYELAGINIQGSYKNLKYPNEIEVDNGFRITKIESELTVTVSSKVEGEEEDLTQGFLVEFQCGEHVKIIVYRTQDVTADGEETFTAYSRDGNSGALLKDGEGQVNFRIVCDEGYEATISEADIEGSFKNLKEIGDGVYRITKIESDLKIIITVTPVA